MKAKELLWSYLRADGCELEVYAPNKEIAAARITRFGEKNVNLEKVKPRKRGKEPKPLDCPGTKETADRAKEVDPDAQEGEH